MNRMSTPSQNILQLRELAEKLCMQSMHHEYKDMLLVIKQLDENTRNLIANCKSDKDKIKCYETMHEEIANILQAQIDNQPFVSTT